MKRTAFVFAWFLGAITTVFISPARAAPHIVCCGTNPMKWAGNNIFMRTCPGWSGSDLQAIEDAADEWNALTESAVNISVSPDPNPCNQIPGAVDVPPNTLLPQIWYQNGSNPSTALALTTITYTANSCGPPTPCCNGCTAPTIVNADMQIYDKSNGNVDIPWILGYPNGRDNDPTLGAYWFFVTLQHEMGHVIGIDDDYINGYARMNGTNPNGGWFYTGSVGNWAPKPLAQDRQDAQTLYPSGAASYAMLYMSNVQVGADGTSRTLDYDPGTNTHNFFPRNKTPIAGQAFNVVRPGQTLRYQFCRGNLGALSTTAETVRVWRSTDRTLSAGDVELTSFTQGVTSPRTAGCATREVVIPIGTPTGATGIDYYLIYGNTTITASPAHRAAVQNRVFRVIP